MTEREACVAFNLTDRIGSVKALALAEAAGSLAAAWESYPEKISRTGGAVDWQDEFARADKFKVTIVTMVDEAYPSQLKDVPGHPLVLYVKGDVSALAKPSVAIVGTRRPTSYGLEQSERFGFDLASDGWAVVSGLALGIDAAAHRGALSAGGVTIGIIGSGLDRFYPEENRDLAREIVRRGGAVVSEFPFGRPPDQQTFPIRNHVVAALAGGTLAIEAPIKSGTLITTGIAAEIGRTVMALPGRVDSRSSAGCLALIREGATLVRCAADVTEALGGLSTGMAEAAAKIVRDSESGGATGSDEQSRLAKASPLPPPFTLEEAHVMRFVTAEGISVDELATRTDLAVAKVRALTMALRIKGRIRFMPGNRVALPRAR